MENETRTYRGITYKVGVIGTWNGIRWSIPTYDHLGRSTGEVHTQGAFYDDPDEPNELSAIERADLSARKFIDKRLDTYGC